MAIDFIPYEELFAHEYQLNYISSGGNIVVGPYTYNVFVNYTAAERQAQFQVCAKFLNWEISEIQEEWELCMYMYQWIIKSPSPFPYEQYTLSEEITMAISWGIKISGVDLNAGRCDVSFTRTDTESTLPPQNYSFHRTPSVATPQGRIELLDAVKAQVIKADTKQTAIDEFITDLEQAGKANLEAWEATR